MRLQPTCSLGLQSSLVADPSEPRQRAGLSGVAAHPAGRENGPVPNADVSSDARVEVRLLGPLGLTIDGAERDLGSPKQRCVFAVLALSAGQVVSVDRLVHEVWGDEAGSNTISTLQVYISRIRRSLGEHTGTGWPRLLRRPPGYLLDVPSDAVDVHRFARLVAAARARTTRSRPPHSSNSTRPSGWSPECHWPRWPTSSGPEQRPRSPGSTSSFC